MLKIAEKFNTLLKGNDRAHGTFNVANARSDGKKTGVAKILRESTTIAHWEDHLQGKVGLGIIPITDDNVCHWGAIDIDSYTIDFESLISKLNDHKIPAVVCRSKSGGAHVYFFFKEEIPAEDVMNKLAEVSALMGFAGSEVFPKQSKLLVERGDTGNFLNMPYFGGDNTTRHAYNAKAEPIDMEGFVSYAESLAITQKQFDALTVVPKAVKSLLPDGPPCLQHLCSQGFGEGSRNNALFNLGVYARLSNPDHWEQLLAKYNLEYLKPPLGHTEVGAIIKQLSKKDYFYKCEDQPIVSFCNKAVCVTRKFGVGPGQLNNDLSSLTKIDGDPPIWILNVDGQRVELSTESLVSQTIFQKECVGQINRFPIMVNARAWQTRIQLLLDNLTVVEVPPDATLKGEFTDLLSSFCCDRAKGDSRDEILQGIAVWTDDRVYFQVKDVRKHLQVNNFTHYTSNKITLRLTQLKAEKMFWRVKGKGVHVWSLPQSMFAQDDESPLIDLPPLKQAKDIL